MNSPIIHQLSTYLTKDSHQILHTHCMHIIYNGYVTLYYTIILCYKIYMSTKVLHIYTIEVLNLYRT